MCSSKTFVTTYQCMQSHDLAQYEMSQLFTLETKEFATKNLLQMANVFTYIGRLVAIVH
jgi:hypothetical protein